MLTYEDLYAARTSGVTVYTTSKPGAPDSGWAPGANRSSCQWGAPVRIIDVHTGHGLCATVKHADGTTCCYNDDELQPERPVPTENPKLVAALAAGKVALAAKLAERDEQIIQSRMDRFLLDDWIYGLITYSVGEGKDHLELYDARFEDDRQSAQWSADAISRIPGLSARVDTYETMRHIGRTTKLYYLHITWT